MQLQKSTPPVPPDKLLRMAACSHSSVPSRKSLRIVTPLSFSLARIVVLQMILVILHTSPVSTFGALASCFVAFKDPRWNSGKSVRRQTETATWSYDVDPSAINKMCEALPLVFFRLTW